MITIGRKDKIDLPELELSDIEAKIDTGAYGCALHCHQIKVVSQDGVDTLTFKVLDPDHSEYEDRIFRFENFNDKVVRNSGGSSEHRYTITTTMIIFGKEFMVDFSLTDRSEMKHPILLGRKFLTKKFLVDVGLKNLSYQLKTEKE